MLRIKRFVNQLMESNCYVIYDDVSSSAVIIDPASEKSEREIRFIDSLRLKPSYILLTHEHTDHNWGVNALRARYPLKLVCTEDCNRNIAEANRCYFLFYFDCPEYQYTIDPGDILMNRKYCKLNWEGYWIEFILTPGHSEGSACILIGDKLFTGDTVMPFKPYFPKRGGSRELWEKSISKLMGRFEGCSLKIYPGHGEMGQLRDCLNLYKM